MATRLSGKSSTSRDPDTISKSKIPVHVFTVFCDRCKRRSRSVQAEGCCEVCKEFMCFTCLHDHGKSRETRGHDVLRTIEINDDSPTSERGSERERVVERCKKHGGEAVSFFCPAHDLLLCRGCVAEKHKACKVEDISKAAKSYKNSRSFREFVTSIDKLAADVDKSSQVIAATIGQVDVALQEEIRNLDAFRASINEYIDRKHEQLTAQLRETEEKNKHALTHLKNHCTGIQKALDDIKSKLNEIGKNKVQHFIASKNAEKRLKKLLSEVDTIHRESVVPRHVFKPDADTMKLLTSKSLLGSVEVDKTAPQYDDYFHNATPVPLNLANLKFRKETTLNTRSRDDSSFCYITDLAVTENGNLVVTDFQSGHKCVKIVDTELREVVSRAVLPGCPYGVCVLPHDQALVTLPYQSLLQFLDIKNDRVAKGRAMKMTGKCYGVAYCRNKLIVSYHGPPKVEILTLKGQVIYSIDGAGNGLPLFKYPNYITVGYDGDSDVIYVSDRGTDAITQINIHGHITATLRNKAVSLPYGLCTVGHGVFVCAYGNSKVYAYDRTKTPEFGSSTGHALECVLKATDGAQFPVCASFDQTQGKLYVGCYNGEKSSPINNEIQVFMVK